MKTWNSLVRKCLKPGMALFEPLALCEDTGHTQKARAALGFSFKPPPYRLHLSSVSYPVFFSQTGLKNTFLRSHTFHVGSPLLSWQTHSASCFKPCRSSPGPYLGTQTIPLKHTSSSSPYDIRAGRFETPM